MKKYKVVVLLHVHHIFDHQQVSFSYLNLTSMTSVVKKRFLLRVFLLFFFVVVFFCFLLYC